MVKSPEESLIFQLKLAYHTLRQTVREGMNDLEITADTTIVYLDQNMWIDLCKERNNEKTNQDIEDVVEYVEETSDSGEVIYPLSVIHLIETASREETESRSNLIETMLNYSDLYMVPPPQKLETMELEFFVENQTNNEIDIRNEVFDRGLVHGFWGDRDALLNTEDFPEFLNVWMRSRNGFEAFFYHPDLLPLLKDRSYEQESKQRVENLLENMDVDYDKKKLAQRREVVRYYNNNLRPELDRIRDEKEVELDVPGKLDFASWIASGEGEAGEYLQNFPKSYAYLTLTYARNFASSGSIDKNDLNDLMSLPIGIAYSDIVLMETTWRNSFYEYDLNEIYETEVSSNLSELPRLAEERK